MKKLFYIVLAFGMLAMSVSCQRNLVTFQYDASVAGVTFPAEQQIIKMKTEDGNKFLVEMVRGNVKGTVSIPVEITDDSEGVFTPAKKTFDFKDGENRAYIEFSYPSIEDFGGETYEINLTITDEKALQQIAITGINEVSVKVQRQLTKTLYGKVALASEWFGEDPTAPGLDTLDLYNTVEAPNYFIIPKMYGTFCELYKFTPAYDFSFTMEGDNVTIPDQPICKYDDTYGDVWLMDSEATKTGNVITIETNWVISGKYLWGSSVEKITIIPDKASPSE